MLEVIPIGKVRGGKADVVLLHGLHGDWRRTWAQRRTNSSWPEWLAEDMPHLSVWCVRYGASGTRWRGGSMPISDRATSLLAALKVHGLGLRPLVLVGHSLGGLLIKQMVLHCATMGDQYENLMDQLMGVVFFSTPHNGSGLVSVARFFRLARITPLIDELSENRAQLRHLDDWYRNRVTETRLNHLSFFETKNTYLFRVVGEDSGDPQLPGMSAIPVDANHLTICKFSNRAAITYRQVREFTQTCTGLSRPNASALRNDVTALASNLGSRKELRTDVERQEMSISSDEAQPVDDKITSLIEHPRSGAVRAKWSDLLDDATMKPISSDHAASIAIAPAALEALEAARISCALTKRKFVTPHLLLSILDLPNSKVARCFDQVKPGLAQEWHELLNAYQAQALENENYDSYHAFNWDDRYEVQRAKEIARHDGKPAIDELYLLLGILDNHKSKTRRELAEYLGAKRYEYLIQVANQMVEVEDTPGSVTHHSDDRE